MTCTFLRSQISDYCDFFRCRSYPNPPPSAGELNHLSVKTVVASPIVKNIAGATIAAGTGVILGCPLLAGALITLGVSTSWLGGAGIIIAAVGVGLWLLSTYLSTKNLAYGESIYFHILASVVDAAIGILPVIISAAYNRIKVCCADDRYDMDVYSTYVPEDASECNSEYSPSIADLRVDSASPEGSLSDPDPEVLSPSVYCHRPPAAWFRAEPVSPDGQRPAYQSGIPAWLSDDIPTSARRARVSSASQESQASSSSSSRRSSVDSGPDSRPTSPVLQPTIQAAPTLQTAPTMQTEPTVQLPPTM